MCAENRGLRVFYQNVRGLRTKLDKVRDFRLITDFDIIIFTESWLDSEFTDEELGLFDYSIFRCDRQGPPGGGVLIAVSNELPCNVIQTNPTCFQHLFVECQYHGETLIVGSAYIPPTSHNSLYQDFDNILEEISIRKPSAKFLIAGDFNLPHIYWTPHDQNISYDELATVSTISSADILNDSITYLNLQQHNYIFNENGYSLDLILSSFNSIKVRHEKESVIEPVDKHHPPFTFCIPFEKNYNWTNETLSFFDFRNADYDLINMRLRLIDWDNLLLNLDIDVAVSLFHDQLLSVISELVPKKVVKIDTFPPWFNVKLKKMIFEKKRLHTLFKKTGNLNYHYQFSNLRARIKTYSKTLYNNYLNKVEESIPKNIKYFYQHINKLRKSSDLPANMVFENRSSSSPTEIADFFANFFNSVFTADNSAYDNDDLNLDQSVDISHVQILEIDIFKELSSLDVNTGPGLDEITNLFLRSAKHGMTKPLHLLFNKSLSGGVFPALWKTSLVRPIFKSGNKSDIKNYRPISIINSIPKLFEKIVCKKISPTIDDVLIDQQHGFRPDRSTSTNLVLLNDYLFTHLDKLVQVDVVYTDFAKAFDRVNHSVLLRKLRNFGISGSFYDWLSSYLSGRSYVVKIGSHTSSSYTATSGVPQGSHLGPLLFIIFINDIARYLKFVLFLIYADDLKLYHAVYSTADCDLIQRDLNSFYQWCVINKLYLSIPKCKVIKFTRKHDVVAYNYNFDGEQLSVVSSFKDLGVYYNTNGSFNSHITNIISKAKKSLGFINRNSTLFRLPNTYRTLYMSLVRPILEYASPVWSPYTQGNIDDLETIQHKFLRRFMYKSNLPLHPFNHDYTHALLVSELVPLNHRRILNDLLFLFNIINKNINVTALTNQVQFFVPARSTRNPPLFRLSYYRTDCRFSNSIERIRQLANIAPITPVNFDSSINVFRQFVLSFDLSLIERDLFSRQS